MEKLWNDATSKKPIAPLRKVPGEVKPSGKLDHEVLKFRDSIRSKSLIELQELLRRQDDILNNKKLVSKLPDQGAKVREKRTQIQLLMEEKSKIPEDQTLDLMANLKLIDTEAMEWKHGGATMLKKISSDEETDNVFRTLATKEVPDKQASKEFAEEFAIKMDERVFTDDLINAPFQQIKRTQLDNQTKAGIQLQRSADRDGIKSRRIEVMPLPPSNYQQLKVQQLPLKESMQLQKLHMKRLKEAQVQNAIERLTASSLKPATINSEEGAADKMAYREKIADSDDSEEEQQDESQGYEIKASDDEEND